jgi:hypothetical protein
VSNLVSQILTMCGASHHMEPGRFFGALAPIPEAVCEALFAGWFQD